MINLQDLLAVASRAALLLDVREEVRLLQVLVVQLSVRHFSLAARDHLLGTGLEQAATAVGAFVHY